MKIETKREEIILDAAAEIMVMIGLVCLVAGLCLGAILGWVAHG